MPKGMKKCQGSELTGIVCLKIVLAQKYVRLVPAVSVSHLPFYSSLHHSPVSFPISPAPFLFVKKIALWLALPSVVPLAISASSFSFLECTVTSVLYRRQLPVKFVLFFFATNSAFYSHNILSQTVVSLAFHKSICTPCGVTLCGLFSQTLPTVPLLGPMGSWLPDL